MPAAARELPAFLRDSGRWVHFGRKAVWMAPLTLHVEHGRVVARAASGPGCNGLMPGDNGIPCGSEISNNNDPGYCMSSFGQRQGGSSFVQENTCNDSANQTWWMAYFGANSTWEIWNMGSSCPGQAWANCGSPGAYKGSTYGYGYCVDIRGATAGDNVPLIMWGCGKEGGVAGEAFYGIGTTSKAWIVDAANSRYCVSNLGNAKDTDKYEMFTCNNDGNQTYSAGAFAGSLTGSGPCPPDCSYGPVRFTRSGAGLRASAAVLGRECFGRVFSRNVKLSLVRASTWPTDNWAVHPPAEILPGAQGRWESHGGFLRGCHAEVVYDYAIHAGPLTKGTVEFSETKHFDGTADSGTTSRPFGGYGQKALLERLTNDSDRLTVSWKVY